MSSYFPDPVDEPPASNSASGSRGSRSHVGHFANTLGAVAHSAARGADNGRSFSGSYSSHSEALTSTPPFFPRGQQQPSGRGPAAVAAFTHAHVAQTDVSGSPLPTRPPPFTRLSAQSGAASSSRSPYSSERDVTRRSVWRDVQFPTAVEHRSNPMLLKQLWTKAVLGEPVTVESTLYLPKIVVQRAVILSLRDIATGGRGAGFAHEVFLVGRQRAATLEGSDSRQSTPATNTLAFERVASTEAERRQGPDEVWMRVTVVMNAQNAPSSASGASFNQIDYQRLMAACVACDRSHPAGLLQLHSLISFSNSRVEQVFEMQTLAVFPSLCLQLAALLPLRLFASPLAEVLCQASHSNVEPQAGYLTLDRGRRVIPLLHSDAVVSEWPVIGVWVRGVQVTGSAESGFNGLDNSRIWKEIWFFLQDQRISPKPWSQGGENGSTNNGDDSHRATVLLLVCPTRQGEQGRFFECTAKITRRHSRNDQVHTPGPQASHSEVFGASLAQYEWQGVFTYDANSGAIVHPGRAVSPTLATAQRDLEIFALEKVRDATSRRIFDEQLRTLHTRTEEARGKSAALISDAPLTPPTKHGQDNATAVTNTITEQLRRGDNSPSSSPASGKIATRDQATNTSFLVRVLPIRKTTSSASTPNSRPQPVLKPAVTSSHSPRGSGHPSSERKVEFVPSWAPQVVNSQTPSPQAAAHAHCVPDVPDVRAPEGSGRRPHSDAGRGDALSDKGDALDVAEPASDGDNGLTGDHSKSHGDEPEFEPLHSIRGESGSAASQEKLSKPETLSAQQSGSKFLSTQEPRVESAAHIFIDSSDSEEDGASVNGDYHHAEPRAPGPDIGGAGILRMSAIEAKYCSPEFYQKLQREIANIDSDDDD